MTVLILAAREAETGSGDTKEEEEPEVEEVEEDTENVEGNELVPNSEEAHESSEEEDDEEVEWKRLQGKGKISKLIFLNCEKKIIKTKIEKGVLVYHF